MKKLIFVYIISIFFTVSTGCYMDNDSSMEENSTEEQSIERKLMSSDATLSDLTNCGNVLPQNVPNETLSPEFSLDTYSYTIETKSDTIYFHSKYEGSNLCFREALNLNANVSNSGSTVAVNGQNVEIDSIEMGDVIFTLSKGENIFSIEVTSENGENSIGYTLTVNKVGSDDDGCYGKHE